MSILKKYIFRISFIWTIISILSCNKTKTVILSKYINGNPQEIIEIKLPITKDSIGLRKVFFENGKLQAFGQSKNGKRQGEWVCFYQNGKTEWKTTYKDDIENGEVLCYDTSGYWRKFNVKYGIKEGKYTSYFYDWFDSVNCYINGYYINDIEQGLWTKTDTSGILLVEMTYINGKAKGYFTNRYKNGKVKLEGEIDENGSMKNFKFYDENGSVKKKNEYQLRKI